MAHIGRYYGVSRKNYLVSAMKFYYGSSNLINTQEIISLRKRSKKDLEARAKNSEFNKK